MAIVIQDGKDANRAVREGGSNHQLGDRLPRFKGVIDIQPDGGYGFQCWSETIYLIYMGTPYEICI